MSEVRNTDERGYEENAAETARKTGKLVWVIVRAGFTVVFLVVFYALIAALLTADFGIIPLTDWFDSTFGVSIQEVIYTITMPMKGADTNFMESAVEYVREYAETPLLTGMALVIGAEAVSYLLQGLTLFDHKHHGSFAAMRRVFRIIVLVTCIAGLWPGVVYAESKLHISEYLHVRSQQTELYDDYYIEPMDVISSDGKTKNIINIYLESMETTYASKKDGGWQAENNYIPNLTYLANKNICFTGENGTMSGSHPITGTTWTMGALFATTTGVPFTFPVEGNSMDEYNSFATGITAIGDILDKYGYTQEFLCGSDGEFAGRREYFEQHGNYKVYDYYTAIEDGYIDKDYFVWWGFEDSILYKIAKDEITKLAKSGKPFNFTLLTVDTHHVAGYFCDECEWVYPTQLENVIVCADYQVAEFIEWIQKQDFYEDTVIMVTGDHPRMDILLVDGVDYYDRTVYNCFISKHPEDYDLSNTKSRKFTPMDLMPTALSFMGFDIEGNRMGLGTNLFSDVPTLAEDMGYDKLEKELSKYSEYYITKFN